MRNQTRRTALMGGAALLIGAVPAFAQDAPTVQPKVEQGAPEEAAEIGSSGNEIVVTARRRDETLQDVPQTVNAVTSEVLQKMRINTPADIQNLVPGVNIEGTSSTSGGQGASTSIRGVPTFVINNANPVVQYYLNEAPAGRGPDVFFSIFDVGQIEVLKGPQGTLRGRSAPSGSITVTTRLADLHEAGGYVNLSGTHRGNINAQGAIGVPIVPGVLALRVAAALDHNDVDGVSSAARNVEPDSRTEAVRASLRFEPSDSFNASVMYQHLQRRRKAFGQVTGPGNGLNGPAITPRDRLGIADAPLSTNHNIELVTGQFEWRVGGQRLSYVGSYRDAVTDSLTPQDSANVLRGVEYFTATHSPEWEMSHELRLSSEEQIAGIFDYTVGVFYDRNKGSPFSVRTANFLSGAFGRPGTLPVAGSPLGRYTLPTSIDIGFDSRELSFFGNLTAHIGERTELSAGGRYITYKRNDTTRLALGSAFNAVAFNPALPCTFIPGGQAVVSPVYGAGVCDVPIAAATLQTLNNKRTDKPFVYNLSASHKFSDDFMVFANTGTAFRSAGPTIGIIGSSVCCTLPSTAQLDPITDLIFHEPEKSTTYEIGFKATFFDRRARLNVSVFKQKFNNYFFLSQPTRFLSITDPTNPAGGTIRTFEFTSSADASSKGFDIDAGFQVTPRWSLNAGLSWSKANLKNAQIPCNDGNFDGTPDTIVPTPQGFVNAGVIVARCASSRSIARTARWSLTAQSEYNAPISSHIDGFIRGNFAYYPKNPNASEGLVVNNYGLLNVFLGIRSPDNVWEVSVFAQNLTNTSTVTSRNAVAVTSEGGVAAFFGNLASGYNQISLTPRREFGLNVRYAFGSR